MDQELFLQHLAQHKRLLYKVAHGYCRHAEDRRDLVQDMVVQLWRAYPGFDGRVQFSTWMYRIAMNVAISHYRSEARQVRDTVPLEEFGLDIAEADQLFNAQSDNMRTLDKLIRELDELNRALILLFMDGHGNEEIASIMGLTATNVATRMSRIKQKLQSRFAEGG
ncbi:RNA polymerase sigma factor [Undibacterium sp. TS12]|uniref:RNA polymerase sigma factor n=1 Tax=Undibacterium sp. TS12 TaxID=2908202 RepID=UPI001F4CA7B1|nr:RNA polymerase sigma factor [Undibacterium sp. TS12]MCH8619783.1 RNA polymerase sigma factor [Undibacterium sp. TS12]